MYKVLNSYLIEHIKLYIVLLDKLLNLLSGARLLPSKLITGEG